MLESTFLRLGALIALACGTSQASAYELYANDTSHLDANLEAVLGLSHSQQNYAYSGRLAEGSSSWREGYVKYGVSLDHSLPAAGTVYAAFSLLSSGTWGDGDAAGFTDGSERTTKIEDANAGWRSGNLFEALGNDGVDLSFGRQAIVIGDGFLIDGDTVNLGHGLADGAFNRGGAYYIGARKSFDQTAVLRLGGKEGWRSDLMWLQSDNPAQTNSRMFAGTLEHVAAAGTFGLTAVGITDSDERLASINQLDRDGMNTYSLRAQSNAGLENLFLSGEFVWQDKPHSGDENAWYLEAGWTFLDTPWTPAISYRYSRYAELYDPLFTGFSRGYGTWVQGEVAGNFAGPFNTNARIQKAGLTLSPTQDLCLGVLFFNYDTINRQLGNVDGREVDLYAQWAVNEHLMVIPVVGIYAPEKSAQEGGFQLANTDKNIYTQLVIATHF